LVTTLTTNSGMHFCKSSIIYSAICVGRLSHGFSVFGRGKIMEKSWKINIEKEWSL